MESINKKLIVILGPNASGKSNLGVLLAKKINGEIISADSRQVYKNLNIGSGKITKKEMKSVKHYCLDIANPKKVFTAYDFQKCAQKAILEIWRKGKTPIIVGGTGFYIDSAIGRVSLSNIPPDPKLRKKLFNYSTIQLFNLLKKLDPKKAKNIDKNNPVRLIRAIEVANRPHPPTPLSFIRRGGKERGNQYFSERVFRHFWHGPSPTKWDEAKMSETLGAARWSGENERRELLVSPKNILWIGIKRSKEDLKKRVHKRLIGRLPGIIKEIKKLRKNRVSWKRLFDLGLEYRYVSLYLQKKLSKNDTIKKLESEINKYAKRQITYWRRNKEIKWLSVEKAKKLGQRFALA